MVELLSEEARKLMSLIKQSSPNDKTFIHLQKCSQFLTTNLFEKVLARDCPDDIKRLGWIFIIKYYFETEALCEDIYELFDICEKIGDFYNALDKLKIQFFNYLKSRLDSDRLIPDKLVIIKFIQDKMTNKKNQVFDLCRMRLNQFYEEYLNIDNFLDMNDYYLGNLVGELILETFFTPGFLDVDKFVNFYIRLKEAIDLNITSLSNYKNAQAYLKKINQLINLPTSNSFEFEQIKSDYLEALPKLKSMGSRILDNPTSKIPKSITDLIENAKKAAIIIDPQRKHYLCGRDLRNYNMRIYHYSTDEGNLIIIKQYALKAENNRIKSILLEFKANEVAEAIRERLENQTSFLRYHGFYRDEEEERLCLVMKYGGTPLSEIISKNQNKQNFSFSEDELKDIFKKLIRSFYELKKAGILHSDIKPHNLLVDDERKIHIIDFGGCRIFDINKREQKIKGTSGYASPELALFLSKDFSERSFKYDVERSDVFSLGMVFLEMIYIKKLACENSYERLDSLYGYLNRINFEWARDLIWNMIKKDPWDRPNFRELNSRAESLLRNT